MIPGFSFFSLRLDGQEDRMGRIEVLVSFRCDEISLQEVKQLIAVLVSFRCDVRIIVVLKGVTTVLVSFRCDA